MNSSLLQTLAKGIEKGKALARTANIYLYGGHGSDICDKDTKEVLIDIVPDDCIYVSIGECGRVVVANKHLDELFASPYELDRQLIRNIFQSDKSLKEFAEQAKISPDSLHIHYPGMKYVVNNFFPVAIYDTKYGTAVSKGRATSLSTSGLIDKTEFENLEDGEFNSSMVQSFIDILGNSEETFQGSNALSYLEKRFQAYPHVVQLLKSRRAKKKLKELSLPNEEISVSRLKPVMEEIIFRYPKETILHHFKASVYPTKDEVEKLLDGQTFSTKDLHELGTTLVAGKNATTKYHFHHNSSSPFTNKALMAKFPGIHFNFTCRDTSKECEAHTQTRRQESEQTSAAMKTRAPNNSTLGKDYEYVIEWMQEILERDYRDVQARRVAMYNSLRSIQTIVAKLSPFEKEEVIKFLFATEDKILVENSSKQTPIQKKILHFISPDKYSLQGGTRRQQRKRGNKSRKA